ncbi:MULTISPECIES: hypothetical protein [Ramlibacter]|uniref:Uncharacterized protein n=1 Tax=Ramlibacter pinisoli TaxID=2682844 RepID=A0A6N8IXY3_9BURK|nr:MULTISPECIES: hypothetical protein [Ramlibacter]MBA2960907.1 hypothetical protein [Ramlibacter sp. CGMCC 1.13660]MVQ30853.1 hypothetical protein [Ramlibacter pinisoli]
MLAFTHWLRTDPRRLCVVGVWLSLAGVATTFTSLTSGQPLAGLATGLLLTAIGSWTKAAGRDLFRRDRTLRRCAALHPRD